MDDRQEDLSLFVRCQSATEFAFERSQKRQNLNAGKPWSVQDSLSGLKQIIFNISKNLLGNFILPSLKKEKEVLLGKLKYSGLPNHHIHRCWDCCMLKWLSGLSGTDWTVPLTSLMTRDTISSHLACTTFSFFFFLRFSWFVFFPRSFQGECFLTVPQECSYRQLKHSQPDKQKQWPPHSKAQLLPESSLLYFSGGRGRI